MVKLPVHRPAAVHINIQFTAWISIVLILLLLQLQTPASTPSVTRVITSSTSVSLVCISETAPIWCIDGVRTNVSGLPFGIVEKLKFTTDRMANSTLCINGSKISNNTEFQCKTGEIIALEVTLVIQGMLEAPGNFEVLTINSTAIQLSWEAPFTLNLTDSGPDILGYIIDITRLNSAGDVVQFDTVHTNETLYIFSMVGELLNPCDTFNFSLRAINVEGSGKNVVRFESFLAIPNLVRTTITCGTRPVVEFKIRVNVSCPGRLPDYIHINITAANSSSHLITSFTYNVTDISATGEITLSRSIGSPCSNSCEAELSAQNEAGVSPSSTVLFECQENTTTTNDGNPTDSETAFIGAIVGSTLALALAMLTTLLAALLLCQRKRRTGQHTSGRTASNIYEENDSGPRREIQYADIDVGQALRQQAPAPVIQDLGSKYTHIQPQSQL